ncbi:MAG TPA: hypothetical protein VJR46_05190, partial [Candidatus Dormibacteraeota bacterium]|nr:hypothetical protein [Candidatus Dormibacteraeota bacterium]
ARRTRQRADEEYRALATRLMETAGSFLSMDVDQDAILAAAEQAAALAPVLRAARVLDAEIETLLSVAARGLRRAVTPATEAIYRARVEALDARLV